MGFLKLLAPLLKAVEDFVTALVAGVKKILIDTEGVGLHRDFLNGGG
jgi:hypothetical protein